jgi:hypothetical protein
VLHTRIFTRSRATTQEDEEVASERVQAPRRAHDGDQAIMATTKIQGLGGQIHANAS